MGRNRRIVAGAFRIVALLLGVSATVAFGGLTYFAIDLRSTPLPPPDKTPYLDIGTYGLVGLLSNSAKAVGAGVGPLLAHLSAAAMWLITGLAIASLVVALFALLLYLTGRGIARHTRWARITASFISAVFLLVSILALTSLRQDLAPLACVPVGLSLYSIWVLGWRYG